MIHCDFTKQESGLFDILASTFKCTSELGLWMTSIHWVITNIYPQGVANHRLTCIYLLLEGNPSIASMNNPTLWPYFSPSYLQLEVEWVYLVPPLFLAYTCNRLKSL